MGFDALILTDQAIEAFFALLCQCHSTKVRLSVYSLSHSDEEPISQEPRVLKEPWVLIYLDSDNPEIAIIG